MSRNFIFRTLTAGLIAAAVIAAAIIGTFASVGLIILISFACIAEFMRLVLPRTDVASRMLFTVIISAPVVVLPLFYSSNPDMEQVVKQLIPTVPVSFMLCVIVSILITPKSSFRYMMPTAVATILFAAGGLMACVVIGISPMILLAIFIILWSNDVFAYLVGSQLGRHKMIPAISPGKSWEGWIGGLVFCIVAAYCMSLWQDDLNTVQWISVGAIIAITGTFGDLLQSVFKRQFNAKDSGTFLPGHGGFWDRFDSFFGCIPFVATFLMFVLK